MALVVDSGAVVAQAIRRPVRLTPDGYAGIVFEGAVFPLFDGDWIDVSGASWEPEDARRFLIAGAKVPHAPGPKFATSEPFAGYEGDWHLESTSLGHYLQFNGPERIAVEVTAALARGGLPVQRWDVSYRPAENGRHYDWFARLRFPGTRVDLVEAVRAIFAAPDVQPEIEVAGDASRIADLQQRVESLAEHVVELQARLEVADAHAVGLRSRLDIETERGSRLDSMLERALEHQRVIADRLASVGGVESDVSRSKLLAAERLEREEMLEFVLAENAELERRLEETETRARVDAEQVVALTSDLIELAERVEELSDDDRARSRQTAAAPPRGVVAWVLSSFPRLEFVLDSLDELVAFEATQGLNRVLVEIDSGDSVGRDLEGVFGWREVSKVATGIAGREDMGRVYYRPGGGRVLVCVHIKRNDKEQTRQLRRLAAL
ncbi:MAG: hypothetical protein ABIR17_11970 [Pseudolysinimonas sp.]